MIGTHVDTYFVSALPHRAPPYDIYKICIKESQTIIFAREILKGVDVHQSELALGTPLDTIAILGAMIPARSAAFILTSIQYA